MKTNNNASNLPKIDVNQSEIIKMLVYIPKRITLFGSTSYYMFKCNYNYTLNYINIINKTGLSMKTFSKEVHLLNIDKLLTETDKLIIKEDNRITKLNLQYNYEKEMIYRKNFKILYNINENYNSILFNTCIMFASIIFAKKVYKRIIYRHL
jgi:hypothetical protein